MVGYTHNWTLFCLKKGDPTTSGMDESGRHYAKGDEVDTE